MSENQNPSPSDQKSSPLKNEPIAPMDEKMLKEMKKFSGIDDLTPEEMKELQEAFDESQASQMTPNQNTPSVNTQSNPSPTEQNLNGTLPNVANSTNTAAPGTENLSAEVKPEFRPDIGAELEAKIQAELDRKKKTQGVKTITKEDFIKYLASRRNKIVYHALWYLAFNIEDHEASKKGLYDALKEVTSKSPIEPIDEHKFYFGLGFILRLKLFDQPVVQYQKGKLKITVNIENLQEILKAVGEPKSDRPIITQDEKNKMFADFLSDDFKDI